MVVRQTTFDAPALRLELLCPMGAGAQKNYCCYLVQSVWKPMVPVVLRLFLLSQGWGIASRCIWPQESLSCFLDG